MPQQSSQESQSTPSPKNSNPVQAALGLPGPEPRKVRIAVPYLHKAQAKLFRTPGKRKAARCGRRWGKNVFGETLAISDSCKGRLVGWFAPENKRLSESYNVIAEAVHGVKKRSSKTEHIIETINGGKVEFWSMEDENAGRSRKYHRIIIDEAAICKPKAIEAWQRSIEPTLVDYDGSAIVMSNTNGIDPDNFMWQICNEKKHGFIDFHAPTTSNPLLPLRKANETITEWLQRREKFFTELKATRDPLVWEQEFEAKFVNWSGHAFFPEQSLLENGLPAVMPVRCETVFATIDTATKTGKEHDGTGVVYWAVIKNTIRPVSADGTMAEPYRVVILDWDVTQIEGALLVTWLPNVFKQLEHYARECRARMGSTGAFIEDKSSGMVLIQHAQRRAWPVTPINGELTDLATVGKDERAISVSSYVHRGMVRISRLAYDKITTYKNATRNHLLGQVVDFRIGDKTPNRSDDLFDCFAYGIAIALGNAEGF